MCAIDINGGMHTLVLDTVETITQYNQSEGYEIGDVKLIFKNTHDDEENGKPKKFTINAKSARAPDVFYFVHIDVDLDQIANCHSDPMATPDNPAASLLSISEHSDSETVCTGCLQFIKSCFNY